MNISNIVIMVDEAVPTSLKDYDVGRELGEGRYGKVYLVKNKLSQVKYALKVLSKNTCLKNKIYPLLDEVDMQKTASIHENVLDALTYFEDNKRCYIVMPYMPYGDLYEYQQRQETYCFSPTVALSYVRQISDALAYCHTHGIIHNDVKPENILLETKQHVVLTDFGWATYVNETDKKCAGTLEYLCPTKAKAFYMGNKTADYNEGTDVWALGVVFYELLTGQQPFHTHNPEDTLKRIIDGYIKYPDTIDKKYVSMLREIFILDQTKRQTADRAFKTKKITKL